MICFDPIFAKKYGLHEAIVYARIRILLKKNEENVQNYYRNRYWVDLNNQVYVNFLNFISKPDVEFAVENLKKNKVLDDRKVDETFLYTLTEEYVEKLKKQTEERSL